MENDFDRAMAVVKINIDADPFYTGKLREFYVAVKCLIKTAETGKGVYLAQKRHIKTIYNYAIEVADVTGTIEVIMGAVAIAVQKVSVLAKGSCVEAGG